MLRGMGLRLMNAQEEERRRIAAELHDDINQRLSLLAIELDMLDAGQGSTPGELGDSARNLASDVHRLAHGLNPVRLGQIGIRAALEQLCREIARSNGAADAVDIGLEIDLGDGTEADRLPPTSALCLYRIAQEALHNSAKYSDSSWVQVELVRDHGMLEMLVRDGGRGFDPSHQKGLGLVTMRERAHAAGGRLEILSAPGQGTTIQVRIPLDETDVRESDG
jgi:signal transduction histidine kinase